MQNFQNTATSPTMPGKFKPILFSTAMVQAILRGEKTQTRRIIKPQPIEDSESGYVFDGKHRSLYKNDSTHQDWRIRFIEDWCIYKEGDILWVKETWHTKRHNMPTGWNYEYKATAQEDGNPTDEPWKPAIHMPKEACRILLRVTKIRIERLEDITKEDAIAEHGFPSLNANPWVFVYEFERMEASFACR